MSLEIKNLCCGYKKRPVLKNINIEIEAGEILCILGPNGVGKTTLLKSILGFLKIISGEIILNGTKINNLSNIQLAKYIAYVPQVHTPPFPYKVLDVVVMGKTAHLGYFESPSKKDYKEAEEILEKLGVGYLKALIYTEISGGERQLVLIARALIQNPRILIMDEPTSNLDFGNQIRVLKKINELSKIGISIVMTSHYPEHAFLCSAKIALIEKNGDINFGSADEIITEENMKKAYGITVKLAEFNKDNGEKIKTCIPIIS
jgi:iron complex transport system ATP-binding protein